MKVSKMKFSALLLVAALAFGVSGNPRLASAQGTVQVWTKFNDQNPQNTQDKWLQASLADFAKTGTTAVNTFQPYDQINAKLNVAVQAKGDVPDLSYVDSQQLGFFTQNGTLTDLTDYVKSAPWYKDLDAKSLATCTTPDGKIFCVPTTLTYHFRYYWTGIYPDGAPATTDDLLASGKALKDKNQFAFTGKLAEKAAVERIYYGLIVSYGGQVADAEGKAVWANDATVKVIEWARQMFADGYLAKESLAPGFDNEQPFMRGEAGSFVAGSYSYVYLSPITSPKGTKFDKEITGAFDPEALSVGAALAAGELGIAPPLAAPGGKAYSSIFATAWAIPVGAKNVDGAKKFIDFQMTTANNIAFASAYGALPTMKDAQTSAEFKTPYWSAVNNLAVDTSIGAPGFLDYDKGITLLADAIVKCVTDPSLDIMAELQAAQDEYNAGL